MTEHLIALVCCVDCGAPTLLDSVEGWLDLVAKDQEVSLYLGEAMHEFRKNFGLASSVRLCAGCGRLDVF